MLLITGRDLLLREIKDFECKIDEHRGTNNIYRLGSNNINKILTHYYKDYRVSFKMKGQQPYINGLDIYKFYIYDKEHKQRIIFKLWDMTETTIINGKYELIFQRGEINVE